MTTEEINDQLQQYRELKAKAESIRAELVAQRSIIDKTLAEIDGEKPPATPKRKGRPPGTKNKKTVEVSHAAE